MLCPIPPLPPHRWAFELTAVDDDHHDDDKRRGRNRGVVHASEFPATAAVIVTGVATAATAATAAPPPPQPEGPPPALEISPVQGLAILLLLEASRPTVFPRPAPPRHCHCPPTLAAKRFRGKRTETTLNFYEAVTLLNNIDRLYACPTTAQRRQLISLCLDPALVRNNSGDSNGGSDGEGDGGIRGGGGGGSGGSGGEGGDFVAGGGWRLTSERPSVLTAKTWSELRSLYGVCLVYTGTFLELCVQAADQIRRTGVVVPGPYEPPLAFRWAATGRRLRRGSGCCESIVHRFGKLVWELVYADDIADELACRDCSPVPAFTDWDSLLAHVKADRANGGSGTEFDLLNEFDEPIAGFRLIADADGREEAELQLHLVSSRGPSVDDTPTAAATLMNDFLGRIAEREVGRAEAAAVAVGCRALPLHRPTVSREGVAAVLRLTDPVLKKVEKFQAQVSAWGEHHGAERKSGTLRERLDQVLARECSCCARSHEKPYTTPAETGQQHQHLATSRKGSGAKGESPETKRKTATQKAVDVATKTPNEQAADFLRSLGGL